MILFFLETPAASTLARLMACGVHDLPLCPLAPDSSFLGSSFRITQLWLPFCTENGRPYTVSVHHHRDLSMVSALFLPLSSSGSFLGHNGLLSTGPNIPSASSIGPYSVTVPCCPLTKLPSAFKAHPTTASNHSPCSHFCSYSFSHALPRTLSTPFSWIVAVGGPLFISVWCQVSLEAEDGFFSALFFRSSHWIVFALGCRLGTMAEKRCEVRLPEFSFQLSISLCV